MQVKVHFTEEKFQVLLVIKFQPIETFHHIFILS